MKFILIQKLTDEEREHQIDNVQTVLGRGKVFEINDKKVSRNHAVLMLQDDKLILKSTHTNPCFLNLKNRNRKVLLKQGGSITLNDGDEFSLLQDCYSFSIKVSSTDIAPVASSVENCNVDFKLKSDTPSAYNEQSATAASSYDNITTKKSNKYVKVSPMKKRTSPSIPQKNIENNTTKKRKLPDWMNQSFKTANDDRYKKNAITKKKADVVTSKSDLCMQEESSNLFCEPIQTNQNVDNTDKDSQVINNDKTDYDNTNMFNKELASKTENNFGTKICTDTLNDENNNNGDGTKLAFQKSNTNIVISKCSDDKLQDSYDGPASNSISSNIESCSSISNKTNANTINETFSREPCAYGKKCYRKNPNHFAEFSHPGDEDYISHGSSDSGSDNDSRPECEYGLQCYRKNPLHRKTFKHTVRVTPKRKATAKPAHNVDDNEDEYDEDDSFINDEDSDELLSDGSDWTPSQPKQIKESDSDTVEDLDDLVSAAKQFTKNKKLWKK